MNVKIVNKSHHPLPEYKTKGSAGMDVNAFLEKDIVLKPLERQLIPTGLFLEIPFGYEVQVRPRSGMAYKHGITVANAPGTIDSDYRGELKIILVNLSNKDYTISDGDRVAQIVFAKHEIVTFEETDSLDQTIRGEQGFGHTGK